MRILILGSNGFVGSALMSAMRDSHDIVGIDLCWFGPDLGGSIIRDMGSLDKAFISEFDLVVCLAAHSSVPMSVADPAGAIRNNVVNMTRLLSLLDPNQRLIYASSTSIYGAGRRDADESSVSYQLSNAYDMSKQIFDDIALDAISRGQQIVGLRFGSVVGISPNSRTDIAINNMMMTAHKTGRFWIADGHLHRSWLTINDAVSAIRRIAESDEFVPGMYNLKSFDCTIGDVARAIQRIAGYNYDIKNSLHSSYDFTVSSKKLQQTYQWDPSSTLDQLIVTLDEKISTIPECRRDSLGKGVRYAV